MIQKALFILIMIGLLLFAAARFVAPNWMMNTREAGFDQLISAMPRATPKASLLALVAIDQAALNTVGQWPWPRHDTAMLVDKVFDAGAAVLVLDINFALTDRFSLDVINSVLDRPLRADQMRNTDLALQESFEGRPVILASFAKDPLAPDVTRDPTAVITPLFAAGYFGLGEDPVNLVPQFADYMDPLPELAAASYAVASTMAAPDLDGKIRRVPLVVSAGEAGALTAELRFFLALEAIRVATGAAQYTLTADPRGAALAELRGLRHIALPDRQIPTDQDGTIRLYESETLGAPVVSAKDVIESKAADALKGKIVFMGLRTFGLGDRATGPLGQLRRGIDFQVLAAEQILARQFLQSPRFVRFIEVGLAVLVTFAILGLLAVTRVPMIVRFGGASLCAVFPLFLSYALFRWAWFGNGAADEAVVRYLVDGILPSLFGVCVLVLAFGGQAIGVELQKRRLRMTFDRYLSPTVVTELMAHGGEDNLQPRDVEITVLFADIRGFTTLSEQLSALQTVTLVNRFLAAMSEEVLQHNGTIDKFLGDGLMAFWNAPLQDLRHRENAITAALELVETIAQVNKELMQDPQWATILRDHPLKVGVGIHTGLASVGNFGSAQRIDYSCIGDTVNTAARIEGLCKEYAATVLVSKSAWVPKYATVSQVIENATVRGRAQGITLFDISPDKSE